MKKASPESQTFIDRIRSWARTKAYGPSPLTAGSRRPTTLTISNSTRSSTLQKSNTSDSSNNGAGPATPSPNTVGNSIIVEASKPTANNVADSTSVDAPPPAPPPQDEGQGSVIDLQAPKKNVAIRFYNTGRDIVFSSWINVLLAFVPVGIAVNFVPNINPTIIFVMNAIAIIPLAGLLSHATESVAKRMGDTIGALMNITFGNAVEIIIFIALAHNEIPIVQAALLGSILANLLLILGMCFLVGGLRFREQIYNSTVTQMSACLLSLSVMSLLLPTAFHASFTDINKADRAVLQVSRGTSVILLLVYGMYLLFQLKSHAYMYESTPQHVIDEESAPGPVAAWMDSSSSDDDSSSGSDSDGSRGSNTTAGRIRRVMRGGRRRRKSSAGSRETDHPVPTRTPSYANSNNSPNFPDVFTEEPVMSPSSNIGHRFGVTEVNDDADDDMVRSRGSRTQSFNEKLDKRSRMARKHKKKRHDKKKKEKSDDEALNEKSGEPSSISQVQGYNEPRRVDFAMPAPTPPIPDPAQKKPFTIRGIGIRPAISKTFSPNIFTQPVAAGSSHLQMEPAVVTGPIPHVRYGIRRTNSLPDRLSSAYAGAQPRLPSTSLHATPSDPAMLIPKGRDEENISRTTAVVLLFISTGLVALCANFMVDSIDSVTSNTSLGATFVGLILLPIVGNAAEHVTAVTVASKNKMDLAIGVAVGSSIQIALFITPFIVLLGWCMGKAMTLYFTLFETVSLFVSVFVVNFLVLDGRSNYLEGALLCAAYVIIAVAAFFYPGLQDQNSLGGGGI